jgi:hypothetical protein
MEHAGYGDDPSDGIPVMVRVPAAIGRLELLPATKGRYTTRPTFK